MCYARSVRKFRESAERASAVTAAAETPETAAKEAAETLFELLMAQKRVMVGVAKEFGLTLQQLAALRNLEPGQGLSMSGLAEALSCDAANVTAVVDKLEARGLVRRSGSTDRRVRLLETTARGTDLRNRILARLHEPTPWIVALDPHEQRQLRDLLRKGLARAAARAGRIT